MTMTKKCESCLYSRRIFSEKGYYYECSMNHSIAEDCLYGSYDFYVKQKPYPKAIMTGYEKIKAMNIEEIADFLSEIFEDFTNNDVTKWFERNYCDKCKPVKIVKCIECPSLVGEEWHECEFEGNCPHYKTEKDMIKLWLENE